MWYRAVEKIKDPDISFTLSVSISVLALRLAAFDLLDANYIN